MSAVPTLREEVERKAVETLEKLALDLDGKRITEAQYHYGLDVLWSAVAGLAGDDFTMMMEVARAAKRGQSFFTKQYYLSARGQIVRVTNTHAGVVCCDVNLGLSSSRKVYDLRDEPNPHRAAAQKFDDLCRNLVEKGFKEI